MRNLSNRSCISPPPENVSFFPFVHRAEGREKDEGRGPDVGGFVLARLGLAAGVLWNLLQCCNEIARTFGRRFSRESERSWKNTEYTTRATTTAQGRRKESRWQDGLT